MLLPSHSNKQITVDVSPFVLILDSGFVSPSVTCSMGSMAHEAGDGITISLKGRWQSRSSCRGWSHIQTVCWKCDFSPTAVHVQFAKIRQWAGAPCSQSGRTDTCCMGFIWTHFLLSCRSPRGPGQVQRGLYPQLDPKYHSSYRLHVSCWISLVTFFPLSVKPVSKKPRWAFGMFVLGLLCLQLQEVRHKFLNCVKLFSKNHCYPGWPVTNWYSLFVWYIYCSSFVTWFR